MVLYATRCCTLQKYLTYIPPFITDAASRHCLTFYEINSGDIDKLDVGRIFIFDFDAAVRSLSPRHFYSIFGRRLQEEVLTRPLGFCESSFPSSLNHVFSLFSMTQLQICVILYMYFEHQQQQRQLGFGLDQFFVEVSRAECKKGQAHAPFLLHHSNNGRDGSLTMSKEGPDTMMYRFLPNLKGQQMKYALSTTPTSHIVVSSKQDVFSTLYKQNQNVSV